MTNNADRGPASTLKPAINCHANVHCVSWIGNGVPTAVVVIVHLIGADTAAQRQRPAIAEAPIVDQVHHRREFFKHAATVEVDAFDDEVVRSFWRNPSSSSVLKSPHEWPNDSMPAQPVSKFASVGAKPPRNVGSIVSLSALGVVDETRAGLQADVITVEMCRVGCAGQSQRRRAKQQRLRIHDAPPKWTRMRYSREPIIQLKHRAFRVASAKAEALRERRAFGTANNSRAKPL